MEIVGIALTIVGAVSCFYACVEYARSSWYTNSDIMGATFAFDAFWVIGSVLAVVGLAIVGVVSWLVGIPIALGIIVAGKLFNWFLLEPILHLLFKDYRQHTGS